MCDGSTTAGTSEPFLLPRGVKVVRVEPGAARERLERLGGAAEYLLGESRTVEEKMKDYGRMQNYDEGVVSGYAGGGDYGSDQFLETRGGGGGEIFPKIADDVAPDVIAGRVSKFSQVDRALQTVEFAHLCVACMHACTGGGGWLTEPNGVLSSLLISVCSSCTFCPHDLFADGRKRLCRRGLPIYLSGPVAGTGLVNLVLVLYTAVAAAASSEQD